MDWKLFAKVFGYVFAAEMADKTQIATAAFAADRAGSKLSVFAGSATALVLSSAIAVLAGAFLAKYMNPKVISWVAGVAFIAIGVWTIARIYR